MSNHKKAFQLICVFCLFLLAACQTKPAEKTAAPAATPVDQSSFPWSVTVKKWEVTDNLSGSQFAQQYNGDTVQVQYNDKPSEGMSFLLVDLTIAKQVSGASTFSWKNLSVQDSAGNHYARMENDTFLENYKFPRQKSIDLTFGKNEGFICFEIPQDQAKNPLMLIYQTSDESVEYPLQ